MHRCKKRQSCTKYIFTYLMHAKKKKGLGVKLEIAEGLETAIKFSVVYSDKPHWF